MVTDLAADLPARSSPQTPRVLAIGLMSGTSQDGVDVALVETDGRRLWRSEGAGPQAAKGSLLDMLGVVQR